jgi:hypothetical protein
MALAMMKRKKFAGKIHCTEIQGWNNCKQTGETKLGELYLKSM